MKLISWLSLFAILTAGSFAVDNAMAASKRIAKPKEISKEERAKIYKWALDKCRKQYGARLHHVEVEYRYNRYYCYVEG